MSAVAISTNGQYSLTITDIDTGETQQFIGNNSIKPDFFYNFKKLMFADKEIILDSFTTETNTDSELHTINFTINSQLNGFNKIEEANLYYLEAHKTKIYVNDFKFNEQIKELLLDKTRRLHIIMKYVVKITTPIFTSNYTISDRTVNYKAKFSFDKPSTVKYNEFTVLTKFQYIHEKEFSIVYNNMITLVVTADAPILTQYESYHGNVITFDNFNVEIINE